LTERRLERGWPPESITPASGSVFWDCAPPTHTPPHFANPPRPPNDAVSTQKGTRSQMSVTRASGSMLRGEPHHTSSERRRRLLHFGVSTCGPPRAADTNLMLGSGDHVQPGPPADDPSGDMDCSEDHEGVPTVPSEKARAATPPTIDVVAPLSERAVNHGLGRHVCTDGDSEASGPRPNSPHFIKETQTVAAPWCAHLWAARGRRHEHDVR